MKVRGGRPLCGASGGRPQVVLRASNHSHCVRHSDRSTTTEREGGARSGRRVALQTAEVDAARTRRPWRMSYVNGCFAWNQLGRIFWTPNWSDVYPPSISPYWASATWLAPAFTSSRVRLSLLPYCACHRLERKGFALVFLANYALSFDHRARAPMFLLICQSFFCNLSRRWYQSLQNEKSPVVKITSAGVVFS